MPGSGVGRTFHGISPSGKDRSTNQLALNNRSFDSGQLKPVRCGWRRNRHTAPRQPCHTRGKTSMNAKASRAIAIAAFATALISGSAFAATVLASPDAESRDNRHRVDLTFTKWVTVEPGGGRMEGIVAGDVSGTFAGQTLVKQTSDLVGKIPAATGDVTLLGVVYEVSAGDRSFRAILYGGYDIPTNKARLDGVVLGGWLAGEKVHAEFRALPCSPVQPNAAGGTCFDGTIQITRSSGN